uniref:Uncharacterized protein n=1 Tax=Rhizophora mucronata TaxID=61149 RepID=A0A2P2MRU3_RHIMU
MMVNKNIYLATQLVVTQEAFESYWGRGFSLLDLYLDMNFLQILVISLK